MICATQKGGRRGRKLVKNWRICAWLGWENLFRRVLFKFSGKLRRERHYVLMTISKGKKIDFADAHIAYILNSIFFFLEGKEKTEERKKPLVHPTTFLPNCIRLSAPVVLRAAEYVDQRRAEENNSNSKSEA